MSATTIRLAAGAAATLVLAACSQLGLPSAPAAPAGGPVTFTVKVDPAAFSNKKQITVAIWDADQLKIADETSGCSVSKPVNGPEQTTCPPGVTYRKPTPEETIVSRDDLAKGLTIVSKTVTVGERYRLSIGGMAADDCNHAGASQEGTAGTATIAVDNPAVAQTMMACMPTK